MEVAGDQIRPSREQMLGKKHRDQFRRLFKYSAEGVIVAWTGGIVERSNWIWMCEVKGNTKGSALNWKNGDLVTGMY